MIVPLARLLLAALLTVMTAVPPVPTGALNPQVTQANIAETICRPGWTKTIRPLAQYTSQVKRQLMRDQHLLGRLAEYQLDHLIPLDLGGHPTDRRNLWMQPLTQAQVKDKWERIYNRAVCAMRLTLRDAQEKIKDPRNWR